MATRRTKRQIVRARPAETGGVAGSLGLLIARALGVDDVDTVVAIGVAIGFVPAAITWAVNLWRGA